MRLMARPYVSHIKLCDNSRAAMLAAIEIYNKPQTTYREQVVTVLVVNAWELILKAALRKAKKNIFYKKKRGEDYRSFSLEHCIADMDSHRLWPSSVDGDGVRANLYVLTDYRNKIIHLYVSDDLNTILYMFLQQSIVNYRDFVLDVFGKDLADDITWTLLPLAASTPSDAIRSLRVDGDGRSTQVVEDFLRDLRKIISEAEDLGADMGRIAMIQEINLQSGKKISRADLEVAIDQGAADAIDDLITLNSRQPLDQDEYQTRFNAIAEQHTRLLAEHKEIADQINDRQTRRRAYEHYKKQLTQLGKETEIEYSPFRWHTLVDHAEVGTDGTITFTFRDGTTTHC